MDEKKLSKKLEVEVHSHGGCTVMCMYTYLTSVVQITVTDEVLNELHKLIEYIREIFPTLKGIVSL